MKVSGFTFVRNGTILGYPYLESIKSLLQLCDEVVVAVGLSEDDTFAQIQNIQDPKLKIIQTTWNENMHDRGYVYAQQKMIAQFNCTGDWAFYLEADEVIHEKDIPLIKAQMKRFLNDQEVEALVFNYYHFYGSPKLIAKSPRWYEYAPRIIRNTIRTWAPDGLFWIVMDKNKKGRYPKAALVGCHLYHYGHLRLKSAMNEKNKRVEKYWGNKPGSFSGYGGIDNKTIIPFKESHPLIISSWLENNAEQELQFDPNYKLTFRDKKHRVIMFLSKLFGDKFKYLFMHKHFKLIRKN